MKITHALVGSILLTSSACALAADKKITINSAAGYYDERVIPANIRTECTQLGTQFSLATKKSLEKGGWDVNLSRSIDYPTNGTKLKLLITSAQSSGNAFMGHSKSVSIEAGLYQNEKLVDTFIATRNSNGGIGGGFKGSCAVLARCVNTLGKDVAKWMKKQKL